jgi:WS/DGAT/MGAT family acyltransferase
VSYDRLSGLDNSFLLFESETAHMHVASLQIHEAAPLRLPNGALDIDRIREYVVSRLHQIPRYRQRIAHTPIENHPVWVDDPSFNIEYHVRHTRLPHPGSERQLKRLTGRIFSQQLDRDKPLWEMFVIEGLEDDRIAILSKVHHCMVDGVSGSELISVLLAVEPKTKPDPPAAWVPRPAPSAVELGAGEIRRVLNAPIELGKSVARVVRDEDDAQHALAERLRAFGRMASNAAWPATPAPFNQPIGSYRRVDWLTMPLDRVRKIRKVFGGTINDVVLATTAGAMGQFLSHERGIDPATLKFRVLAPVSTRSDDERGQLGNRVSFWVIDLPIAETDPVAQLEEIQAATRELKASKQALGAEVFSQVTEWTGSAFLSVGSRLMQNDTRFNMVVTNVPGPQLPLYLLDSQLLEIHPMVPLIGTMGLGIALFTYNGTLSWGFASDWELVPDLHDLTFATRAAFEELYERAAQV